MLRAPPSLFQWIPGRGYDEAALKRLREAFPRPTAPMGEAWFMGETRKMYPELLGDLEVLSVEILQRPLVDIASGTHSFGPMDEWEAWFRYLLPRLIPRSHETDVNALLELLITAFIPQYPIGMVEEPYAGFRADVLSTLGQCVMDHACWPGGDIDVATCLNKYYVGSRDVWFWDRANGPLSASMFFCLKYLASEQVGPWLASVLSIESPIWRAQVMMWLLGAHGFLIGSIKQPSELTYEDYPNIEWEWSHCLDGSYSGFHGTDRRIDEFLPAANRARALETVTGFFSEDVFLSWVASICTVPSLEGELADAPYWFYDLYRAKTESLGKMR